MTVLAASQLPARSTSLHVSAATTRWTSHNMVAALVLATRPRLRAATPSCSVLGELNRISGELGSNIADLHIGGAITGALDNALPEAERAARAVSGRSGTTVARRARWGSVCVLTVRRVGTRAQNAWPKRAHESSSIAQPLKSATPEERNT